MRWRKLEVVRGAFGLVLLVAPGVALRRIRGVQVDSRSVAVSRVLGARQLVQAGLSGVDPSPEVAAMGIWVDLAHAATAVGFSAIDPARAPAGLLNAGASLAWAGWGRHLLLTGPVPRPAHQHGRDRLARRALEVLPGGQALLGAATRRRT